jgi:hypothetical protein
MRPARPGGRLSVTGVGSVPGEDPREAARTIVGELPDLPYLPELPGRGPWADMVGRGCALLVDLPTQVGVGRWELTDREGRDVRRARSMLGQDLDALEEELHGFDGTVKVQACGPLTLAATIERRNGERAVGDVGARRDIADSLTEGLRAHVHDLRRRLPRLTSLVVQLDEPALPMVLAGAIPSSSGYRTLDQVAEDEVRALLGRVVVGVRDETVELGFHCCAAPVPTVVLGAGDFLSVPVAELERDVVATDQVAGWLDAGRRLFSGVSLSDPDASVDLVRRVVQRTGLAPQRWDEQLVVTPECGLAGTGEADVVGAYQALREVARRLSDDPEGP